MTAQASAPEDDRLRLAPEELAEEARVGTTPAGQAVNAALLALSRAARGYLFYEPGHAAIRLLIEDLRIKVKRALDSAGDLDLEVRPFELAQAGEVVYREEERERSLAFRLFRDGVRRLRLAGEVRWEEVLRLLEILSVRVLGILRNEDDTVTLLRKAGLVHVSVETLEGRPSAEEEKAAEAGSREAAAPSPPAGWDLPPRELPPPAALEWRDVPDEERAALAAEEAPGRLPANAVQAAKALLDVADAERSGPGEPAALTAFIGEVRDFLLSEGHLKEIVRLVRALAPEACAPIRASFAEKATLRRLVLGIAPGALSPPAEMFELLDLVPADHLATVLDLLGEDVDEQARRILRQLVERYGPAQGDLLLARMRDAPPRVACDLLRACARALPERALEAALDLAAHPDASVVHEALRRFEKAPAHPRIARILTQLLERPQEDVRLRALDLLGRRRERTAFGAVAQHAERRAVSALDAREADLIGRTLARLAPESCLSLFDGWLRPVGSWVDAAGARMIQWVVASGLGSLAGSEAEALLREVADKNEGDLKRHALEALARHRHKDRGDG
jgi:hypothetical protein